MTVAVDRVKVDSGGGGGFGWSAGGPAAGLVKTHQNSMNYVGLAKRADNYPPPGLWTKSFTRRRT